MQQTLRTTQNARARIRPYLQNTRHDTKLSALQLASGPGVQSSTEAAISRFCSGTDASQVAARATDLMGGGAAVGWRGGHQLAGVQAGQLLGSCRALAHHCQIIQLRLQAVSQRIIRACTNTQFNQKT
jgi:hypothetical protein